MNILHLSAVNNWGGGENQIELLCREFKEHYPEVKNQILCKKGKLFHKRLEKTNLKFLTASLAFQMDPRYIRRIISICKKENIDLIHIHDSTALSLAIIADNLADLPPMVFSKKTSFPIRNRKQSLYKYNHPKLKKIFCVSKKTRNVTSEGIQDENKLVTLYHGIDPELQRNLKPGLDLRNFLKIPSERKIIGNIANHIEAKDLQTLVKTANQLINRENRKDFHFVQIGGFEKPRTSSLLQEVKQFGLEEHFSFLGFRENAAALIPQFDISIITSESEGLPQFIYESFFHKIPVISTGVGGISEIITHKINGLLAQAHDHKKLCENILILAENEELIPKFAEISHQMVLQNFTSEIMMEKTLIEYKKILHERL
ncbi:glycosyltransferase family 4 protein [Salegentibacter sp.]|uniref:glycosyltransferase family 4 protein n=1 Tax=Salegentibacter sp. TaxID=1903072 RepID=UPI003569461E